VDTQVTANDAALVAQAVGALVLGALLLDFHRHYRKAYLLHWAWSWVCFCVYAVGAVAGLALDTRVPPAHPAALLAAAVSGIAAGPVHDSGRIAFGPDEMCAGNDVIAQTQTPGFHGIDYLTRQDQFARAFLTNHARQQHGGDGRKHTELYLRLSEPRAIGGNHDIARSDELTATTKRRAVN